MTTAATTTAVATVASPSYTGGLTISPHDFELVLHNHYDEHASEVLRFWFFTAKAKNWNLKKLSAVTGMSTTVLYRLMRGEYPADTANAIATLDAARATLGDAAENPEFIETSLAARMFTIFDKTRALRNVSILFGRMGIGKTECISEYLRRSPVGRTAVVRFPAGASFPQFLQHVGRALGVARTGNAGNTRERITQLLAMGQRLLIVDELHQAFLTTRTDTAVKCCEFLREISDVSGCGLVLVGTEILEDAFLRGPHKEALRQLVDRGTVQVTLPARATKQDYQKFLKTYGLNFPDAAKDPEAFEILNDIIKSAGLRKLTLHLRDGLATANKRGEAYTWTHFTDSFNAIISLGKI
jgi:DNA transposition AAA+ family ATPase